MNGDHFQIRFSDILHVLFKNKATILVLTVLGLLLGIILSLVSYARGEVSKEYAVTTSIAVTSVTEDGLFTTNSSNPNSADIYLAENMVDSVIYVLKSDKLLTDAINRLGLVGVAVGDISANLNMKQYNDTQIIEITLFWRSAEEGVQILTAINAAAPTVLIETLKIGGVSVVNAPSARYRVGGSMNVALWIYMTFAGLIIGMGASLLQMLLFPTLVNVRDMEQNLGVDILGEIPEDKAHFSKKHGILSDSIEESGLVIQENFASAAHILINRLGKQPHQIMYITSTTQDEGKTSIAANLAYQLSELEKKVLLIDFDVRNPSLGSMFLDKVEYAHSLNALYRGDSEQSDAITRLTGYLDLLPAILERKELPLDDSMLALVQKLSENYDYILMDTAPVGRVADPMSLNRISHNALFVVRYDSTGTADIRDALERLDKSGMRIVGCIINGVKKASPRKYYSHYGSYRYHK